jgi:ABC-2 type transport system permease protein
MMNAELRDIGTIVWKEWRELFAGNGPRGGPIRILIFTIAFAILIPIQQSHMWIDSPFPILVDGFYIPFAMVISVAANTFVGERERHTLETLLASRLSDRSILLGKLVATTLWGWIIAIIIAVIQLVVVNASLAGEASPSFHMYTGTVTIGIVLISLFLSILISGLGNLISQRATTVQQAYQTLMIGFFSIIFIPVVIVQIIPAEQRGQIFAWASNIQPVGLLLAGILILCIVDASIVSFTLLRFRRAKIFQA